MIDQAWKDCCELNCSCFAKCKDINEYAGVKEEMFVNIMRDIRNNEPILVMKKRYRLPFVDFYIYHKKVLELDGCCAKSFDCS